MNRIVPFLLLLLPAAAPAQGPIGTADRGPYVCELPGDAASPAGIPQPQFNFAIENSSRYSTGNGQGTYLRRGDLLQMTSGPRKGEAYQVVRPGFLRQLGPDGRPGRLRCVLQPG
jgi:hypothetical protein